MKFFLTTTFLFLLFCAAGTELPEVVARFGALELKKSRFQHIPLPSSIPERNRALKKLVDTEVYMIIVRELLERSGIYPQPGVAERYVAMRKNQAKGSFADEFIKKLDQQSKNRDFQLKAALYFTFYAAVPSAVEPDSEEVKSHYLLNLEKFRTPIRRDIALFKAGNNDTKGKLNAAAALSRLKQGEDFLALARQFDPDGRKNSPQHQQFTQNNFAKIKDLPAGKAISVETPEGIFVVKMVSRKESETLLLEETESYIREMLSSRKLQKTLEQYISEILKKRAVTYCFQVL